MGKRASALLAALFIAIVGASTQDAAHATIESVDGQIVQLATPPASVQFDGLSSDTNMFAFDERQNVTLAAPLAVDFSQPGTYKLDTDLEPTALPAGTVVSSQFVSSNETTKPCGTCARQFEGTIRTSTDILGVIVLGPSLDASDFLGAAGTLYPTGLPGRKLELNMNQQDMVIEEIDRHTLVIHSEIRLQAADQIRVITQGNRPPVVSAGAPAAGSEGSALPLGGSVTDPDGDATTASWSYAPSAGVDAGATCSFASASSPSTTITCTDDGTYVATLTASDGLNAPVTSSALVTVSNAPPAVSITSAPTNVQQGTSASIAASFSDAGSNDTHTCSVAWGDGAVTAGTVSESNGTGTCTASHTYAGTGAETLTVTITDDDGASAAASSGALVYTPCLGKSKVHVRWHYSTGGAGAWGGTSQTDCADGSVTFDRQAMEGDQRVATGTVIRAGYDFSLPGNKLAATAIVIAPTATLTVRCVSGATPSAPTITIAMATQSYDVARDGWTPSPEQKSPLVYQGSATVPDLCGGGAIRLDKGGVFSAVIGFV